jgi:general secretion pathway protein D
VRNTRDNLLIIEEVLEAMDVAKLSADVNLVEIEAKFVEVSEGTLEELGFEWRGDGNSIHLFDDVQTGGNDFLFDDALRGGASGPAMPFSRPDMMGAGSDGVSGDWTAFRFEDTFNVSPANLRLHHDGHVPLDVVISALDQSSGADVLSAPRIVTKSGETATIRVGQLHIYPEIYEASASAGNIVHVKYEDWEEVLLGVDLKVTPQVDGDQIELGLNPKFRELQGWQTYDVAGANSAYTFVQEDIANTFTHPDIKARLPIYRVREVDTEVTIADGATIVMGGLISEKVEAFKDKVPVLGSLPLVGRLFRNEGERSVKRNLMMFVTARKVEPTGRISSARSFE